MKALILAAGHGSRLGPAHRGTPKGLLEVGGRALLDRQLDVLAAGGVDRVCLVTGYANERLEERYRGRVEFRHNPFHRDSGTLVSLLSASDWIDDELIVAYADLLYERGILDLVRASAADVGLVVDRGAVEQGHALVSIRNGSIVRIDPQLEETEAHARHVGITLLSRRGAAELLRVLERAAAAGRGDQPYYAGIRTLIERGRRVEPIEVGGSRWMEIDHPEDLERARQEWS